MNQSPSLASDTFSALCFWPHYFLCLVFPFLFISDFITPDDLQIQFKCHYCLTSFSSSSPTHKLETIFLLTSQGPAYSFHAEHILAAYCYIASDSELSSLVRYLLDQDLVRSTARRAWFVPGPLEPQLGYPLFLLLPLGSPSHTSGCCFLRARWPQDGDFFFFFTMVGEDSRRQSLKRQALARQSIIWAWLYCPQ